MTIANANVQFNENGTPYASKFGDLYFSDAKGLEETQYVFLQNNALPERWKNWQKSQFVIAETGFGTGLNFLVTLAMYDEYRKQSPNKPFTLHFISIEKYPISRHDLSKALSLYPQLAPYIKELLKQYPPSIPGCHRLTFLENSVSLDLWLGDVHTILPQIENKPEGLVNSWYLDGFAPSKNPDMWTQSLFNHMANLAQKDCHFATFTAAGHVRRGLIEAGFEVQKRPGHGRKREMLAGFINQSANKPLRRPCLVRNAAIYKKSELTDLRVAIIGGGIAGANCAYALSKRGIKATIYCKDDSLAQGASGNPQGGFYPQLNAQAGNASLIQATAFCYAERLYQNLLQKGFNYSHQWCGTMLLAFNDKLEARYRKMVRNETWPETLIRWVEKKEASQIANVELSSPGLHVPKGGWINPSELVCALVEAANSNIVNNKHLHALKRYDNRWQLTWSDDSCSYADVVVMATGSDSGSCKQLSELPFRRVRGQVEAIPSQGELAKLSTVICHKGYLTPAWKNTHALGSTYIKEDKNCDYRLSEQKINIDMHQKSLAHCDWITDIRPQGMGRASIRCSTPDHLPMVGAVPNIEQQRKQFKDLYKALPNLHYPEATDETNMFILTGLGSRGLTTAPLCAEILASQIAGEPLPLSSHLLDALNPNRFLIRGLIRREIQGL